MMTWMNWGPEVFPRSELSSKHPGLDFQGLERQQTQGYVSPFGCFLLWLLNSCNCPKLSWFSITVLQISEKIVSSAFFATRVRFYFSLCLNFFLLHLRFSSWSLSLISCLIFFSFLLSSSSSAMPVLCWLRVPYCSAASRGVSQSSVETQDT